MEECGKHGAVEGCTVPQPPESAIAGRQHGRVYVLFQAEEGAKKARASLNGRTFDGNKARPPPAGPPARSRLSARPPKRTKLGA